MYGGPYSLVQVDEILRPFDIGLAPYAASKLTRFINPDKYYQYLNSGMEVISTDIPQARHMAQYIHIARTAGEIIETASGIRSDATFRKNKNVTAQFEWDSRADEFVAIIRGHLSSDKATLG